MIGATAMIPVTLMERALGYFSDGEQGWWQAGQFLAGGMLFWLVLGFSARWVLQGFVLRSKPADADRDEAERLAPPPSGSARPPRK